MRSQAVFAQIRICDEKREASTNANALILIRLCIILKKIEIWHILFVEMELRTCLDQSIFLSFCHRSLPSFPCHAQAFDRIFSLFLVYGNILLTNTLKCDTMRHQLKLLLLQNQSEVHCACSIIQHSFIRIMSR